MIRFLWLYSFTVVVLNAALAVLSVKRLVCGGGGTSSNKPPLGKKRSAPLLFQQVFFLLKVFSSLMLQ